MAKFFIAAGHGGTDPGAVSGNNIERDIAINVVNEAIRLLKNQNTKGREIVLVPHNLELVGAVAWVNKNSNDPAHDLCMEVHLNSNVGTPGTGTETYYGLKALADEVHSEVIKVLKLSNRGVKLGNQFYWNNSTKPGSCLVELGFINNSNDVPVVKERGGLALAKGILRACGGVWVDPVPVIVEPPKIQPAPPVVPVEELKKVTVPITPVEPIKSEETTVIDYLYKILKPIINIVLAIIGKFRKGE